MSNCLAPSFIFIRDFIPETDAEWLHGLWHRAMHGRWAISLRSMLSTLAGATLLQIAEYEGLRSGFCAVQMNEGPTAGLTLLLVEPTRQRRGIGATLLKRAEERLIGKRVRRLTLGAGNDDYFWPGLPAEQEQSRSFFCKHGFVEEEGSEDLVQDLHDFATPGWTAARLAHSGAALCSAEPAHEGRIIAFERLRFPAWAAYFENEMKQGKHSNVLLAQDSDGRVLGTVLIRHDPPNPWTAMAGKQVGTLNTLGVAPDQQGKGIGLALTSKAMEVLRKRGCSHCFIQWTGLKEWYGKLGAETWAHYHMASKALSWTA